MHPALSVIFFTAISGCGFGLLFLTAAIVAGDPALLPRGETLALLALGAAFATAGLLSSMLHLGQPLRAWRAFSQWRTSWLSREGVAAMASFVPLLVLAAQTIAGANGGSRRFVAIVLAALSLITVVCTSGIYTSLKTIAAWHNRFVLPGYLLFALLGGAVWMLVVHAFAPALASLALLDSMNAWLHHVIVQWIVVAVVIVAAAGVLVLKYFYWRFIERNPYAASAETATGLGRFGSVSMVEGPHTEANYLTREMGFVLARKHGTRLRKIAFVLIAMGAALALLLLPTNVMANAPLSACIALIVAIVVTAGTFVERWLFFAQARHVVMLFYGADAKSAQNS